MYTHNITQSSSWLALTTLIPRILTSLHTLCTYIPTNWLPPQGIPPKRHFRQIMSRNSRGVRQSSQSIKDSKTIPRLPCLVMFSVSVSVLVSVSFRVSTIVSVAVSVSVSYSPLLLAVATMDTGGASPPTREEQYPTLYLVCSHGVETHLQHYAVLSGCRWSADGATALSQKASAPVSVAALRNAVGRRRRRLR